ncbi:MAG: hypothetical protein RBT74_10945 [Tenuifilaceae bacterium]|jgi:hypothetical protein|nr:hypothetical protein [Tenuifilaceae bacterium]
MTTTATKAKAPQAEETAKIRTVIRQNRDQAEQFLTDYQNKYIPALEKACRSIKEIGVTPTKAIVVQAITGDFEPLKEAYSEVMEADMLLFKSPAGRAAMEDIFKENIHRIKSQFEQLFTGIVGNNWAGGNTYGMFEELTYTRDKDGNVPLDSISLAQFFDVSDEGAPYMPESAIEAVLDAFRDYANPKAEKLLEAQKKAANALTAFAKALQDANLSIPLDVPAFFFRRYFKAERSEESLEWSVRENPEGIL